jgi:TolB-like protein/DNA-binding winged helix-turn-helix (wHTH) protein/tetratricopeptide (TPR) repeat protein
VLETHPWRGVIRFESYDVDLRAGELRKHGHRIRLQDQPFRILQILLEHPGEVVTREELQRRIWPADTFVDFERGLNNAVKRLREALGDSADSPRYVETLPKRGYRFMGSVETRNGIREAVAGAENPVPPAQAIPKLGRPRLLLRAPVLATIGFALVGASVFALDAGGVRSRLLLRLRPPIIQSLAVLPLQNLSGDPAQEYFADGMTDGLITELAQIGSVRVISRTSVTRYKNTSKTLPEIARELNVDGIIEGTVQRSGDRMRVTAQLIDGRSDRHLWADTYEREVRDIFVLEREITQDVAGQIRSRLNPPGHSQVPLPKPVDLKALDLYLEGSYQISKAPTQEHVTRAQKLFQQATEADPNFAAAYIALAESYYTQLQISPEDRAKGKAAAEKAVTLNPSSSDAHEALGGIYVANWNWASAEAELRRAVALNLGNARAHETLCEYMEVMGRLEEDWNECQIAQDLDPNEDHLSTALEVRRQYEGAITLRRSLAERYPDDWYVRYALFRNYLLNGMPREAIQELAESLKAMGYSKESTSVRRVFAFSGNRAALRELAKIFERLHASHQIFLPLFVAEVYAQLGDKDRAFYWLEQGYARHELAGGFGDLCFLKLDHMLDPLRSDPRFADILRRMGLPQ